MVYFYVLFSLVIVALVLLFLNKKKVVKLPINKITFISSIVLLSTVIIRTFAADGFVGVINGGYVLYDSDNFVKKTDILETLVRWFVLVSECLLFSLFVSKNKSVKWILSYISLPIVILSLAYFPKSISYFSNPIELSGIYFINSVVGSILTLCEYLLLFICTLSIHLFEEKDIQGLRKQTIKVGVFSLLVCVPFLNYQSIFGNNCMDLQPFNWLHICWIILVPSLYILILFIFKKDNDETRFSIISIMVFYVLIHFFSGYKCGYASNRAPFQLCNLAVVLFAIAILTKSQRLFNFIYVANPAGCIVAILVTDTGNLFGFWMIHYVIEHTFVFIVPLLMLRLGFFRKPSLKELLRDYFIFFSGYFVFCLFYNAIHNGLIFPEIKNSHINITNFFFLVRCPLEGIVSFYKYLETGGFIMFGQIYYLSYLIFVYVVYSLISFSIYFVSQGITEISVRRLAKK